MATNGRHRSTRGEKNVTSHNEIDLTDGGVNAHGRLRFSAVPGPIGPQEGRLLVLPAELRTNIYELALSDAAQLQQVHLDRDNEKSRRVVKSTKPGGSPPSKLGLLLSCKQVYVEAIHLYYTSAIFEAPDTPSLLRWLRRIGNAKANFVEEVRVKAPIHASSMLFTGQGFGLKETMKDVKQVLEQEKGIVIKHGAVRVQTIDPKNASGEWIKVEQVEDDDIFMCYASLREYFEEHGRLNPAACC